MNGNRRATRALVAIALGLMGVGLTAPRVIAQGQAESLSASFRKAAQRVRPAVVAVRPLEGGRPFVPFAPPRLGRFGPGDLTPPIAARLAEVDREPGCSAVVIDADRGHILTTDHTLQGASQVVVTFADGRERVTSQIRRDPRSDLALLIVDPQGLKLSPITWGDPGVLEPGDWVIALGQPAGSAPTMSAGIVSARRRGRGVVSGGELIETDAVIHHVNAGGPLVNLNGEVVGINTIGAGRQDGLEGMGWAIPADRARGLVADLIQFGQVRRAYLGVQVDPVDPASGDRLNQPGAVVIGGVRPGSPASEAGLRPGDVILRVGQRPIEGVATLQEAIELAPIGEELTLTIDRQGRRLDVKVRPQAMPVPVGSAGPPRSLGPLLETRRDLTPGRLRGRELRLPRRPIPDRPAEPDPPPPGSPPVRRDDPAHRSVEPPDPRPEPLPR